MGFFKDFWKSLLWNLVFSQSKGSTAWNKTGGFSVAYFSCVWIPPSSAASPLCFNADESIPDSLIMALSDSAKADVKLITARRKGRGTTHTDWLSVSICISKVLLPFWKTITTPWPRCLVSRSERVTTQVCDWSWFLSMVDWNWVLIGTHWFYCSDKWHFWFDIKYYEVRVTDPPVYEIYTAGITVRQTDGQTDR